MFPYSQKTPGSEGIVDVANVSHLEEHQDANVCTSSLQEIYFYWWEFRIDPNPTIKLYGLKHQNLPIEIGICTGLNTILDTIDCYKAQGET